MDYMMVPVGLGIAYLAYKQLRSSAKLGEFKPHVLEAKDPDAFMRDLQAAERPHPDYDWFIPAWKCGVPDKVRVTEQTKPDLF